MKGWLKAPSWLRTKSAHAVSVRSSLYRRKAAIWQPHHQNWLAQQRNRINQLISKHQYQCGLSQWPALVPLQAIQCVSSSDSYSAAVHQSVEMTVAVVYCGNDGWLYNVIMASSVTNRMAVRNEQHVRGCRRKHGCASSDSVFEVTLSWSGWPASLRDAMKWLRIQWLFSVAYCLSSWQCSCSNQSMWYAMLPTSVY